MNKIRNIVSIKDRDRQRDRGVVRKRRPKEDREESEINTEA